MSTHERAASSGLQVRAGHQTPEPMVTLAIQHPTLLAQLSKKQYSPTQLKSIYGMAVSQLVMGMLCIVCGVTICVTGQHSQGKYTTSNAYSGAGIWVGVVLFVTGIVGMIAAKKNNLFMVATCMVLNLVSLGFVCVLMILTIPSVRFNSPPCYLGSVYYRAVYQPDDCTLDDHLLLGTEALLLAICIIQLCITSVSSVIGGMITFCKPSQMSHAMVKYRTVTGAPGVLYPVMTTTCPMAGSTSGGQLPPAYSVSEELGGRAVHWQNSSQAGHFQSTATSDASHVIHPGSINQSERFGSIPTDMPPLYESLTSNVSEGH